MRLFPIQPFWGYFWTLIALVVAGTLAPASCGRPAELEMESVAGVYGLFPQPANMLILYPDGRANISLRLRPGSETVLLIEEYEEAKGVEESSEVKTFTAEEAKEEFGWTEEEFQESFDPPSLDFVETMGIEEIAGR